MLWTPLFGRSDVLTVDSQFQQNKQNQTCLIHDAFTPIDNESQQDKQKVFARQKQEVELALCRKELEICKKTERGKGIEPSKILSLTRRPNSTCFIFYLPPTVTKDSLKLLFQGYGTILNVHVAKDKVTNAPRGFGFVDFSCPSEADNAVFNMDNYPLEGKILSVSIKV